MGYQLNPPTVVVDLLVYLTLKVTIMHKTFKILLEKKLLFGTTQHEN